MSRHWGFRDYDYFPPSRPRAVKGGIKAQSKRGSFGESWWAKRWIAVLESFYIGARLDRGRSYARRGQVLSIDINKGVIKSKVQGSSPSPYSVTIKLQVLSQADWQKLAKDLSQQAIYTAKLLAAEMPQEMEKAFTDAGLALFPTKQKDLVTECSCPDSSNPCKHIAAVYYLLGEEFDRSPFLLFKLRGMEREELVALLDQGVEKGPKAGKSKKSAVREENVEEAPLPSEPLVADVSVFWGNTPVPEDIFAEVQTPVTSAALVKRLGNFPFWRGEEKFLSAIEPIYTNASPRGLEVFLGTREKESR